MSELEALLALVESPDCVMGRNWLQCPVSSVPAVEKSGLYPVLGSGLVIPGPGRDRDHCQQSTLSPSQESTQRWETRSQCTVSGARAGSSLTRMGTTCPPPRPQLGGCQQLRTVLDLWR